MIVWTREEWKEKVAARTRMIGKTLAIMLGATYGVVVILFLNIWLQDPQAGEFVSVFLLMFAVLIVFTSATTWGFLVWLISRSPQQGLYEKGIQFTPYVFLPYREIASMKDNRWKLYPGRPRYVRITLRHKPSLKASFVIPKPILFDKRFLGDEGMAELDRRIRGILPQQGPPELRLYGPAALR